MLSVILESGALSIKEEKRGKKLCHYFELEKPFNDFTDGLYKIYDLYQSGTIEKKLFDLWVKDEMNKNKDTNIKKAIEDSKPNFSAGNMDDYEDLDTDDDDLPF